MLENKIAIVTGGSTGIGYGICNLFAKEKATVVMCGITEASAKEGANKLILENKDARIVPRKLDITKAEEVSNFMESIYKEFGKIDILVNNAGVCFAKSLLDTTEEDFINLMNVNTNGTFRCTKEAVKYMKETGGSIINTSSMVGTYGSPNQVAYTASKFAINGITKSCAKELGKYNIRVNAVAPGVVKTKMTEDNVNDEMEGYLKRMTPLGRAAIPSDLAGTYLYLASDLSKFTTGAIIAVDGGLVL